MRKILTAAAIGSMLAFAPAYAAVSTTTQPAIVVAGALGTYTFSVGGWAGGGTVTGSFDGLDGDLNGQLSWFDGEVTGFTMSYSGGAIVPGFGLGFTDLFGLVYDLDGGVLGDGIALDVEGIGAIGATARFLLGPGPFARCGATSAQPCGLIEVTDARVDEPSALGLALAGMALLVGSRRRRTT